ncbi:heme-binding protein [Halostella sp. JP-L12]|uniref:heme-binding protein n=1 Tax=Halostella TaxID=1843185 RepID=UPI000EF7DEB3|nr:MULTISPECIES: heme-binding protein [Halostella]NHN46809.1 heme-binding protein [Halostella sp. JP-L12]
MDRRDPPPTEEGWYVLHDLRTIDWDAWRAAPDRERERALEEGVEYLEAVEGVDADRGDSAVFSVVGHKADLMFVHLRPTMSDLDALEREFEGTAFAGFTEQSSSYVSVTEASGYTERARDYFEGEVDDDSGLAQYIRARIHPGLPEDGYVSFYPMSKRRDPEYNWYDLPFDERAEHMADHGDIGRDYAGKVNQIITGSVGFDDWEWGVTLFADDPTDIKDLLYEMRFDPSSSKFAEFGQFYFGRRFPPADLDAFLAGEKVPTDDGADESAASDAGSKLRDELDALGVDADAPEGSHGLVLRSDADAETVREEVDGLRGNFEHYDTHVLTEVREDGDGTAVVSVWETESAADTARGFLEDLPGVTETTAGPLDGDGATTTQSGGADDGADAIRDELDDLDIYAGQPRGEDVYALVLYTEADPDDLHGEVEDLRDGFDRYDTHVKTAVYAADGAEAAVVSIWDTADAADTASDFLSDLPGIVRQAGDDGTSGFGTMGMFYTVKPEHRDDFVEKFGAVGDVLADMDGHRATHLYANREDENDMFIASRWDSKEDCMDFFRSDAFADTVDWGRDVLADRPRHVFLA